MPKQYGGWTPVVTIPLAVVLGIIMVSVIPPLILYDILELLRSMFSPNMHSQLVKSRKRHRQRDVESAECISNEAIDLQSLNNANPSQKYKQVEEPRTLATSASTQSSSAEIWYVPIALAAILSLKWQKCNLPRNSSGSGRCTTIEMQARISYQLHRLLATKSPR